jgi:4-amino-4-deoxy-L-arabinose transferase-like glycosyltransferase
MDAAYYVDGALGLYEGRGFSLPLIWNYLEGPVGLPHPSHLYWMPLSSILAYLSFLLLGPTYRAAQVPFVLLSALLPVLAYLVAYDVAQKRRHAMVAGLMATFSGFYMAYWVTPDAFAPFALAGGLCLWALGRGLEQGRSAWYVLAGTCAGLAHLSRADGLLLVGCALLLGLVRSVRRRFHKGRELPPVLLSHGLLFVGGYLLVMLPWFVRNWRVIGRPLSTASMQTLWLTDYDDLYSYGKPLTLWAYLTWGWGNILLSKLRALWLNAQTLFVVGGMIFNAALGLVGAWRLRRRALYRPAFLYGALLYVVMSLAFTFPGWRGGMLHSTVALLPTVYAAAMEGLDACVAWVAARRRHWRVEQAQRVLSGGLVVLATLLSGWLYLEGLGRFRGEHLYSRVAAWMRENLMLEEAGDPALLPRVMVNDAPSFYYHGRLPALAIPNADVDTVLDVMDRFEVEYLLLDGNYVPLATLYQAPRSDERLLLLTSFGGGPDTVYLYRFQSDGDE